jgi:hypothetical protein
MIGLSPSQERAKEDSQENQARGKKQEVRANLEVANDSISDWA